MQVHLTTEQSPKERAGRGDGRDGGGDGGSIDY